MVRIFGRDAKIEVSPDGGETWVDIGKLASSDWVEPRWRTLLRKWWWVALPLATAAAIAALVS